MREMGDVKEDTWLVLTFVSGACAYIEYYWSALLQSRNVDLRVSINVLAFQ